jgi:hypothetical protein
MAGRSRRTDPSTSHEAGDRLDTTQLQQMVLDVVRYYGGRSNDTALCVVQIHNRLPQLSIDTISPRMKPLTILGLLECLGKQPRANRHGRVRAQLVYRLHEEPKTIFAAQR